MSAAAQRSEPDGFVVHLIELLRSLGRVEAQLMFGGHGIYCDGLFIAIVLDSVLYLKADEASRAKFEAARLAQFEYARKGKRATLNFYRALEEALESPRVALQGGREALAAALRARAKSAWRRRR